MKIISHRGYWKAPDEKNRPAAFVRSFDMGFGTETDVRDLRGDLVISHDMPVGGEVTFSQFAAIFGKRDLPLALNIKSDGLAATLSMAARGAGLRDWFVFDMAVPDMRAHLRAGNPVFTRMSEVEREPAWLEVSAGVWLDAFDDIWFDAGVIASLLNRGKRVCVVSAELHGRDPAALWNLLRACAAHPRLMLCTDRPEDAVAFLGCT